MKTIHNTRPGLCAGLILGLGCCATLVGAAPAAAAGSAEALYRQERADCMSDRSAQDRPTCLREASAALAEARRGRLGDADAGLLAQNALLRCQRVPPPDRAACERLARGEGQRSGSVAEGAILKEITILQTVDPPTAASSPR